MYVNAQRMLFRTTTIGAAMNRSAGWKISDGGRCRIEVGVNVNKALNAALAAMIGLSGWTKLADADLFSAAGPVIAILAGELFVGVAEGHLSGAGTIVIHSQKTPELTCDGQFTSSAALGGAGEMHCSDGASATFSFQRLSVFSGHGVGKFSRGSMSFTYGLTVDESIAYLKLPAGKRLVLSGAQLVLLDL